MLSFFRGLAVPSAAAASIKADIERHGLHEGGRRWTMCQQRPPDRDVQLEKPRLTLEDTRGKHIAEVPALCACGEEDGAAHYAWRHNRSAADDAPLMVEFRAPVDGVAIDGRDFLYTMFQRGSSDRVRAALAELFGPQMLRYAERAWAGSEAGHRIATCDLATFDPDVIMAHHANRSVIAGRYRTLFRSAFTVTMPIPAEDVVRVWRPTQEPPLLAPQISIADMM